MTLSTIIGVGIGIMLAWRVGTIAVCIWRAWGVAEQERRAENTIAAHMGPDVAVVKEARAALAGEAMTSDQRVLNAAGVFFIGAIVGMVLASYILTGGLP